MEASFVQFLAASPNRTPIHIIQRLEQSRVELNRMVGFRKRELGHGRVELQLETLQEDRMIDASFRATPAQDAVSEDELHAFCFAIDAAVERIKRLKNFHRRTSGLFRLCPLLAQNLPTLQVRDPGGIIAKLHDPRLCTILRSLPSLLDSDGVQWVVPPVSEPSSNFFGWFGRPGQAWTLHLQNEIRAALFRTFAVPVPRLRRTSLAGAALYGWVLGKIAQSQMPGLLANLPFRGITVLVQCFQIAEHASELLARHAEFFGVHDLLPL